MSGVRTYALFFFSSFAMDAFNSVTFSFRPENTTPPQRYFSSKSGIYVPGRTIVPSYYTTFFGRYQEVCGKNLSPSVTNSRNISLPASSDGAPTELRKKPSAPVIFAELPPNRRLSHAYRRCFGKNNRTCKSRRSLLISDSFFPHGFQSCKPECCFSNNFRNLFSFICSFVI